MFHDPHFIRVARFWLRCHRFEKDASGSHLGFFCRLSAAKSILCEAGRNCATLVFHLFHIVAVMSKQQTEETREKLCERSAGLETGLRTYAFFIEVQSCLLLRLRTLHAEEAEEPGSRSSTVDKGGDNMTRPCKYSAQY